MSTELLRRAVPPFSCLEALTLEQPAVVASIHRDYRTAGAEMLTTNTFGASGFMRHTRAGYKSMNEREPVQARRSTAVIIS